MHIQYVMLREFKNNKNSTETKFLMFMNNVLLLTAKVKTGFQSFVPVIRYWMLNLDQNAHQTLLKIL